MSSFHRKGHYRNCNSGKIAFVSDHWVSRVFSPAAPKRHKHGRTANKPIPQQDLFFNRFPEFRTTPSRHLCFVRPNSRCPVCGVFVFYYQNEFGSRVYFDHLGPPWPKHPCTDGSIRLRYSQRDRNGSLATRSAPLVIPIARRDADVSRIGEWLAGQTSKTPDLFAGVDRQDWRDALILKRIRAGQKL